MFLFFSAASRQLRLPLLDVLFHNFFPPLAAPVNLRTGIYDTALAPLVDIPISMQEKRKARRKSEDLRYQLQKQLIHGTSLKSTCWTIGI